MVDGFLWLLIPFCLVSDDFPRMLRGILMSEYHWLFFLRGLR
jgi:hypothetical protein